MADEAEKVVVEILAKVDGFDSAIKTSAAGFAKATSDISASATKAEGALGKTTMSAKDFAAALKASGNDLAKIPAQMDGIAKAAANTDVALTKVGHSSGNLRIAQLELGHVIRGATDQFAAGTPPMQIFATHLSQVAQAASFAGEGMGAFGAFMATGWGVAIGAGAAILIPLIANLFKTEETVDQLVEKMKKKHDEDIKAGQVTAAYNRTLEGRIDLEHKLTEELDNQIKSQRQLNLSKLADAKEQAAGQQRTVESLTQDVEKQRRVALQTADVFYHRKPQDPNNPVEVTQAAVTREAAKLTDLQSKLDAARASAARLTGAVRTALIPIMQDAVEGALDPVKKATDAYTDAMDKLNARQKAGTVSARAYGAEAARLSKELEKVKDAAKKHSTDTADLTPFISPVSGGRITGQFGEARTGHTHAGLDIAVPVGTAVKAPAAGIIIEAGVVPGYGNAIYIDHGRGTITRLGHLSQIGVTRGQVIEQGQVIGRSGGTRGAAGAGDSTGPHLHYEVRVNNKPVDPRKGPFNTDQGSLADKARAAAERARAAAEAEVAQRKAFLNDLASGNADELEARKALIQAADDIDKIELEAIEAVRKRKDTQIQEAQDEFKASGGTKGLNDQQAAELRKINDATAALRVERVQRAADERKFRIQEADAKRKLTFDTDSYNVQEEILQSQEGIAKTARQRHDIEQRLINLKFDEEKLQLEAIIAARDLLKLRLDELAKQRKLSDDEKASLADANDRATTAQGRLDSLPGRKANAQTSNDRSNASPLQQFIQEGTKTGAELNDALEGVAAGGLKALQDGLVDAIVNFRSLGDVARAVLRQILSQLLQVVIQMLIVKALKLVLGLSDGGSVGSGSVLPSQAVDTGVRFAAEGGPAGFPGGGHVRGAGTSTSDSIPAMLSDGEFVLRKRAVDGLGLANLQTMNRTGRLPGFADGGLVRAFVPVNAPAAASGGRGSTELSPDSVRELRGIVRDAAMSSPDVKLYPTLDPAAALRAALASPGGQRAMFDFVSNNPGKFNSSLRR